MLTVNRNHELRARRMAATRGYFVQKSRKQESYDNFGQFRLVDASTNCIVLGSFFDATPEEIISYLKE